MIALAGVGALGFILYPSIYVESCQIPSVRAIHQGMTRQEAERHLIGWLQTTLTETPTTILEGKYQLDLINAHPGCVRVKYTWAFVHYVVVFYDNEGRIILVQCDG